MPLKHLQRIFRWVIPLIVVALFLPGCTSLPFLTTDNSYSILKVAADGTSKTIPIQLPWNANAAVLRKLLLEASFTVSDLHSNASSTTSDLPGSASSTTSNLPGSASSTTSELPGSGAQTTRNSSQAVYLVSVFPQGKQLALNIDDLNVTMDVKSIQVEVQGPDVGRVVLNQSWALQGISDPNLTPAYLDFLDMLKNHKDGL